MRSVVHSKIKPLKESVDKIITYINRKEGRELTQRNCVEKLAESVSLIRKYFESPYLTQIANKETQEDTLSKKLEEISNLVNKAVQHLPSASAGETAF